MKYQLNIFCGFLDDGLGWGSILGIVLGCLVFVVIVLVIIVICCYYYNNRKDRYGDRYSRGGRRPYGPGYSNRGYSNMNNGYKVRQDGGNPVADPGFLVGDASIVGEGAATQQRFVKFVCQNEGIGTPGGVRSGAPHLDSPL